MSVLTIKEVEDIFNIKKSLTRQKREKFKAWADEVFIYIHEDLALKIIMNCGGPEEREETIEFRSKLEFKQYDIIMNKEQSVSIKILKAFPNEEISLQHISRKIWFGDY